MASENPYDEIPYLTLPRLTTHPDRLAAVGRLFGMDPAPLTRCRVLEVGCGDGSNLVPMAYYLPEGRFTGVDLATGPIAGGRETIAQLGLSNISLLDRDLREMEGGHEFDYIIAHGFYSWVPPDVRDRLLACCRQWLAPHGVAFISYNIYPGRHVRQMLREMMLYHTRDIGDYTERGRQARWLLEFLRTGRTVTRPWREMLDRELDALLERPVGSLYHDDLSEYNDAVYFRDFAAHAGRHGLQYVGDADLYEMFDPGGSLSFLDSGNILEREQYHDFLTFRTFRQTLLCRAEITLDRDLTPQHMEHFLFSAPAKDVEDGRIEGLHHMRIRPVHDSVRQVTAALGETYPLPLTFEELIPYAGDREALRDILYGLIVGGFADLHVYDFPCEETVTARPRASRLARHQAELSAFVTSACHRPVKLDEVDRRLVCLMDGTRDHRQLAQGLGAVPGAHGAAGIPSEMPAHLEWLARMGLLEG